MHFEPADTIFVIISIPIISIAATRPRIRARLTIRFRVRLVIRRVAGPQIRPTRDNLMSSPN